jgi:hypothetical protein
MARAAAKTGSPGNAWRLTADQPGDAVTLHLAGPWTLQGAMPSIREVEGQLPAAGTPAKLLFETGELGVWDTSLLTFLIALEKSAKARMTVGGLPAGIGACSRPLGAVRAPEARGAPMQGVWLQRRLSTIASGRRPPR